MDPAEIAKLMGFSSFGNKKSAMQFDVNKMFEESRKLAADRNKDANLKLENQYKEESGKEVINAKPNLPKTEATSTEVRPQVTGKLLKNPEDLDSDDEDNLEDNSDMNLDPFFVPSADSLVLKHSTKPLTALALDPSGARVATGGLDFEVKLWDFAGMDKYTHPFKSVPPAEEQQVTHLEFSPTGDMFMLLSNSSVARIYDRDGTLICETNRGYPYIAMPANSKGHSHGITGGAWHPLTGNTFLTSSLDSSLRLWDVNDGETIMCETKIHNHKLCITLKDRKGQKTPPTCCAFSKDGNLVTAACRDGSVQVYDLRKQTAYPTFQAKNAHANGVEVTSIAFSWDAKTIATRSMDDCLRLFDVRNLTNGASDFVSNLPVMYSESDVGFSPNDNMLLTAVSATKKEPESGRVAVFKRSDLSLVQEIKVGSHGSVVRALWHPRTNQICCACSDGSASVYFDPEKGSRNGALMCAYRQATEASRRRRLGVSAGEAFVNPILLTYDEDTILESRKMGKKFRYHTSESQVAIKTHMAETIKKRREEADNRVKESQHRMPPKEEDKANRVGSLHKYMVQQIVLKNKEADERAEKDIRGTILRHAEDAQKKPFWTKAYHKTQPNPVFQQPDDPSSSSK
ncbi:WD repeat-containing protein 70 [Cichlidogyrus casuarinus]|uniref:WD repeat-containing protein 70 n=1 Tax=Cichlidogyrus casuarinus TaxID=1844966 RepID=A0ABD2QB52_9PLAT